MTDFITQLPIITQLFMLTFLLATIFGIVVQNSQFCPLGGLSDSVKNQNTGRLWMLFFTIGIGLILLSLLDYLNIVDLNNSLTNYRSSHFIWPAYLLGGTLFGIGMVLANGCAMRNIVNFASGDLKAFVVLIGMALSSVIFIHAPGFIDSYFLNWMNPLAINLKQYDIQHQDIASLIVGDSNLLRLIIGLTLGISLSALAFRSTDFRHNRFIIGGTLIAGIIALGYILTSSNLGISAIEASKNMLQPQSGIGIQAFGFVQPIGDFFFIFNDPQIHLVSLGIISMFGLAIGSFIWSILTHAYKIQWFTSASQQIRYFIGGILLGAGGILALGGSIGQGLSGTATLSLGSFITLFSMLCSAYIILKIQHHFQSS